MRRIPLTLQPDPKSSEILIDAGLLFSQEIAKELGRLASRFALFCDENIASHLGKKWCAHLEKSGLEMALLSFPPGEQEKSRERKAEFEDLLFSQKFGKDACFIALGGGVATDLIGFLASTYCRGVPLVFVPTTLLCMVDAAIGGKVGINTRFGKNLIGAFYPADKVFIDPEVLKTLPTSEQTSGFAEVIKYALIRSPSLFQILQRKDLANLEKILIESILIKKEVVENDYAEKTGYRRILNFGHTIGHAIEAVEHYRLTHGEAIAMGMLTESYLSVKTHTLSSSAFQEIESLIRSFAFPLRLSPSVTVDALRSALALDKKSVHNKPRFVLLENIGTCAAFGGQYCTEVPSALLEEALTWTIAQFSGEKP